MAKGRTFAKSKTQAKKAARNLFQRGNIAGLGTARTGSTPLARTLSSKLTPS